MDCSAGPGQPPLVASQDCYSIEKSGPCFAEFSAELTTSGSACRMQIDPSRTSKFAGRCSLPDRLIGFPQDERGVPASKAPRSRSALFTQVGRSQVVSESGGESQASCTPIKIFDTGRMAKESTAHEPKSPQCALRHYT